MQVRYAAIFFLQNTQQAPRSILSSASRTCKSCDWPSCTGALLDSVESMYGYLHDANVTDIDPAPHLRLVNGKRRHKILRENHIDLKLDMKKIAEMESKFRQLKPRAELTMLETTKYLRTGEDMNNQATGKLNSSDNFIHKIDVLRKNIRRLVHDLRGFEVSGRLSRFDIQRALVECEGILRHIKKQKSLGESDIRARTELSHARQSLSIVRNIIYGSMDELSRNRQAMRKVEFKVDDLLQFINGAMDTKMEAITINRQHNDTLQNIYQKYKTITNHNHDSKELMNRWNELLNDGKMFLETARTYFSRLNSGFSSLSGIASRLQNQELGVSDLVENYQTRYLLPCNTNAERLIALGDRLHSLLVSKLGAQGYDRALQAANVYKKILIAVEEARVAAKSGFELAHSAYEKVMPQNRADQPDIDDDRAKSLRVQAEIARVKSQDLRQESEGLRQNGIGMRNRMNEMKVKWHTFVLRVNERRQELAGMGRQMNRLKMVSILANRTLTASTNALEEAERALHRVNEMTRKIKTELGLKVIELQSFAPEELGNIPRKVTEARRIMGNVLKQANYLSRRKLDIDEIHVRVSSQIEDIRNRIKRARHSASNIAISITNQRRESHDYSPKGCSRSYHTPKNTRKKSVSNSISLIYGIDTDDTDGLLFYLPGTATNSPLKDQSDHNNQDPLDINREFLALEMINRKIRFSWNVGSGTQHITHNVTLETSFGTGQGIASQDHMWYRITAERIGNSGRLNVRKVRPIYDDPGYHRWVVNESPPGANVFELLEYSHIYVGGVSGIPDYLRSSKLQTDRFNGILYDLSMDGENIGVWNYVASHGCRETHSGISEDQISLEHSSCFTFNGEGYAMQRNIRNYDPRYLSISMEFRTFDADALLLLVVNPNEDQYLSLELKAGHLFLTLHYERGKQMVFLTDNMYSNGKWVKVEAARALRNEVETGILRVNSGNTKEDLMDTIELSTDVSLEMEKCVIYLGGVPPGFDSNINQQGLRDGFLGNMRSITVSNPGSNSPLNPLYAQQNYLNLFYGVESNCERKIVKSVSFEGDGFVELKSQPLGRMSNFGFSFNTMQKECLLVLSAFKIDQDSRPLQFYSMSIMGGKLVLKFSNAPDQSAGKITSFVTEDTYNDGSIHTVTILKQEDLIMVYIDDELVTHSSGLLKLPSIRSHLSSDKFRNDLDLDPIEGRLFVGGLPSIVKSSIEAAAMSASTSNLIGTIKDIAFMDDASVRVISMNEPLSIQNAKIGRAKNFHLDAPQLSTSSFHSSSQNRNTQWHQKQSHLQIQIDEVVDFDIQNHRLYSQQHE